MKPHGQNVKSSAQIYIGNNVATAYQLKKLTSLEKKFKGSFNSNYTNLDYNQTLIILKTKTEVASPEQQQRPWCPY